MTTCVGRVLESLLVWMSTFFVNTNSPDADCHCGIQRKCQNIVSAGVKLVRQRGSVKRQTKPLSRSSYGYVLMLQGDTEKVHDADAVIIKEAGKYGLYQPSSSCLYRTANRKVDIDCSESGSASEYMVMWKDCRIRRGRCEILSFFVLSQCYISVFPLVVDRRAGQSRTTIWVQNLVVVEHTTWTSQEEDRRTHIGVVTWSSGWVTNFAVEVALVVLARGTRGHLTWEDTWCDGVDTNLGILERSGKHSAEVGESCL